MSWEASADLVVVGTGVAGLTAALRARRQGLRVLVINKGALSESTTRWAQGGIAAVRHERDSGDSVRRHAADTMTAGAGLCSTEAVREIVRGGARAIDVLHAAGAQFDLDEHGLLSRTREGGHSAFRVVHAGGDATGAEVQRALSQTADIEGVPLLERHCVADLLRGDSGAIAGVVALDAQSRPGVVRAPAVLLATGGLGQLFAATTNPELVTGDGIALALRAGASIADLEFVQFHPTAFAAPGFIGGGRPLITEAVRGEGAVLIDVHGKRVMAGEHPAGDLAPRDVVAEAIFRRNAETGTDHVYLDATGLGQRFATRFPTADATCRAAGIDPSTEPIPVTIAAHYSCGGVLATVEGRTSVTGLYAAGEVARTGLHGANRLASNSLLEGVVCGERAADAVVRDTRSGGLARERSASSTLPAAAVADRDLVQRTMSRHAGLGRTADGLLHASSTIQDACTVRPLETHRAVEDASVALTAQALLAAARTREESRGCHRRQDRPETDQRWARSLPFRLDVSGWLIRTELESAREAAA